MPPGPISDTRRVSESRKGAEVGSLALSPYQRGRLGREMVSRCA